MTEKETDAQRAIRLLAKFAEGHPDGQPNEEDKDWDIERPDDDDYDDRNEYSTGWDNGYAYAQEHWLVWMNRYRLLDGLVHWWVWRKAQVRWALRDFRRKVKRIPMDDSDIPF